MVIFPVSVLYPPSPLPFLVQLYVPRHPHYEGEVFFVATPISLPFAGLFWSWPYFCPPHNLMPPWHNPVSSPDHHRWELPVLRYHGIRGNHHFPFLRVMFLVILHGFIGNNYHKHQSDSYPFFLIMVNYPTFLINDQILNFQMYYQYLFFPPKYPNNVSKKN